MLFYLCCKSSSVVFFFVPFIIVFFFFFKQKTAYEMRISDWSSDVCSSDLRAATSLDGHIPGLPLHGVALTGPLPHRIKRLQPLRRLQVAEIGRASCRERVCQYV